MTSSGSARASGGAENLGVRLKSSPSCSQTEVVVASRRRVVWSACPAPCARNVRMGQGLTSLTLRSSASFRRTVVRIPATLWKPMPYVCAPTVQIMTTWFAKALPSFVACGAKNARTRHPFITIEPTGLTRAPGYQAGPLTSLAGSLRVLGAAVRTRWSEGDVLSLVPITQPFQPRPQPGLTKEIRHPFAPTTSARTSCAGTFMGHGTG